MEYTAGYNPMTDTNPSTNASGWGGVGVYYMVILGGPGGKKGHVNEV